MEVQSEVQATKSNSSTAAFSRNAVFSTASIDSWAPQTSLASPNKNVSESQISYEQTIPVSTGSIKVAQNTVPTSNHLTKGPKGGDQNQRYVSGLKAVFHLRKKRDIGQRNEVNHQTSQ